MDQFQNVCSICHEPLTENNLTKLQCNHSFHHTCVYQWLVVSQNIDCPQCRTPVVERPVQEEQRHHHHPHDLDTRCIFSIPDNEEQFLKECGDEFTLFRKAIEASRRGYINVIKELFPESIEPVTQETQLILNQIFADSCERGNIDIAEYTHQQGARDPDGQGDYGEYASVLKSAVERGHVDICKFLLRMKDYDYLDQVLFLACDFNQARIVKCILELKEINYTAYTKDDILLQSVKTNKDITQVLLDNGADPSVYNQKALRICAYFGNKEIIELLLQRLQVEDLIIKYQNQQYVVSFENLVHLKHKQFKITKRGYQLRNNKQEIIERVLPSV